MFFAFLKVKLPNMTDWHIIGFYLTLRRYVLSGEWFNKALSNIKLLTLEALLIRQEKPGLDIIAVF